MGMSFSLSSISLRRDFGHLKNFSFNFLFYLASSLPFGADTFSLRGRDPITFYDVI